MKMKLRQIIDRILERIMIVLMVVLVLDVLWQVLSRYLTELKISIPTEYYSFTEELANFLLVWVALSGAAYATGKKQHLAIDLLVTKLSDRGKLVLNRIINLCILAFSFTVMVAGGYWLVYTRLYVNQISPAMEIKIGYVYLIVPFAGILISYYVLDEIFTGKVSSEKSE